jgi:hypothetical protein
MAEVFALLTAQQLQTGVVEYDSSVTSGADSLSARVVSQFPQADSTLIVPAGSIINLVLSVATKE